MTDSKKPSGFEDIKSFLIYVEPLLKDSVEGLTHAALAKEAKKSASSVSRFKNKLLEICDSNIYWLGGKKRFKLKYSLDTGFALLFLFSTNSKMHVFLRSNYFRNAITKIDFHSIISEKSKSYSDIFSKTDTETLVRLIVDNLKQMPDTKWKFLKARNEQQRIRLIMEDLETNLPAMLSGLTLNIKTEEDLIKIIELRKKSYKWIMHIIDSLLERSMAVRMLRSKDEQKYKEYKEGYMYFADFYIKRVLSYVNNAIKKSCPTSVVYKLDYDNIQ